MSAEAGPMRAWVPPRKAVTLSAALVSVALVAGALGWWVGGAIVGIAALLGAVAVFAFGARRPSPGDELYFIGVVAAASAGAIALAGSPAVGAVVALGVVALVPIVRRHGAVIGIIPVMVATLGIGGEGASELGPGLGSGSWDVGIAVIAGAVIGLVSLRLIGIPQVPTTTLQGPVIWTYVALLAGLAGLATATVIALDAPHGAWLVIAISVVLMPVAGETLSRARPRVVGTVVGALVGTAVASLVPTPVAIAVAVAALVLGLGEEFARRHQHFVVYLTVAVIALVGAAGPETAVDAATLRIGFTLAGTVLAVAGGLVLARVEARATTTDAP